MKKSFLVLLNELRGERSATEFALFLGIPQTTFNNYLIGKRKPSIELIKNVCAKCNVSADWLLGIENELDGIETNSNESWKMRALECERKLKRVRAALLKINEGTKNLTEGMKEMEAAI